MEYNERPTKMCDAAVVATSVIAAAIPTTAINMPDAYMRPHAHTAMSLQAFLQALQGSRWQGQAEGEGSQRRILNAQCRCLGPALIARTLLGGGLRQDHSARPESQDGCRMGGHSWEGRCLGFAFRA